MGLLDDAIREHLELKRRHGADAGEVARQEGEALGPARRPGRHAAGPEGPAVAPGEAVSAVDVPTPELDRHGEGIAPGEQMESAQARAPADAQPAPDPTHEWDVESELRREEQEEARRDAPVFVDPDDEPFAEEPEPEESEEDEPEDVLEETPDFLAETPEHDRLWFEQKPPRDFDFDR